MKSSDTILLCTIQYVLENFNFIVFNTSLVKNIRTRLYVVHNTQQPSDNVKPYLFFINYLSSFHRSAERYVKVKWRDVRVGDLVHLSNNEAVPADMVLLHSSNPMGICYLDTCNLDGETNLKQRIVAPGFREKVIIVFKFIKFRSWSSRIMRDSHARNGRLKIWHVPICCCIFFFNRHATEFFAGVLTVGNLIALYFC